MTKPAFTPGPWQVSGIRRKLGAHSVLAVGPDTKDGWIISVHYTDRTDAEHVSAHADARLIAAAPDMYEALTLLLADIQDYAAWQRPCHAIDVARAALTKATGGT